MAQIPRPPKQGNVTTYVAKVAAGYPRILAGEVDADLDTIFGAWNGGVDTVNIRDGAVTSPKLAADAVGPRELQDGGIVTAGLADGAVTTPKLADSAVTDPKIVSVAWGKVTGTPATFPAGGVAGGALSGSYPNPDLRDGAVTQLKLGDGQVTNRTLAPGAVAAANLIDGQVSTAKLVDLAVTLPKIAVGGGVAGIAGQKRTDTLACPALNNEQLYLEYTWASRGGFYLVLAALHVVFGIDSGAPAAGFACNFRLDGTAGVATDGTVQAFQWFQEPGPSTAGIVETPATVTVGVQGYALSAGVHRVKITGVPINRFVGFCHINSGWSYTVEFA
jgi:hypothetical protein